MTGNANAVRGTHAMDAGLESVAEQAMPARAVPERPGDPKRHGDIVVDAISGPTRLLMAGVILVNLSLGAWFIRSADFSRVQPQGTGIDALREAPATMPTNDSPFGEDMPLVAAPSRESSHVLALNERD